MEAIVEVLMTKNFRKHIVQRPQSIWHRGYAVASFYWQLMQKTKIKKISANFQPN